MGVGQFLTGRSGCVEEPLLHGLGQAEGMKGPSDADVLVMHPLGRLKDALVRAWGTFDPKTGVKNAALLGT